MKRKDYFRVFPPGDSSHLKTLQRVNCVLTKHSAGEGFLAGVRHQMALEMLGAHEGFITVFVRAAPLALARVLVLVPLQLARRRKRPAATLEKHTTHIVVQHLRLLLSDNRDGVGTTTTSRTQYGFPYSTQTWLQKGTKNQTCKKKCLLQHNKAVAIFWMHISEFSESSSLLVPEITLANGKDTNKCTPAQRKGRACSSARDLSC